MKKAHFFVDEFINNLIPKGSKDAKKNEWQKMRHTLLFVKNMQIQWRIILLHAIENASIGEKLAQETCPTHIQDDILYVKVMHADEAMLISLHAQAIITHIKNAYIQDAYFTLSEKLTKVKPIYHLC